MSHFTHTYNYNKLISNYENTLILSIATLLSGLVNDKNCINIFYPITPLSLRPTTEHGTFCRPEVSMYN